MVLEEVLESVRNLKQSDVRSLVESRLKEFEQNGRRTSNEIFKELCFCILAANFNAERSMKIQMQIGDGFLFFQRGMLARKLRALGHRFPNTRAKYIVQAREYKDSLKEIIRSHENEDELREWLAENVMGIGYKESSHFLRNIGYNGLAILDFHIIDIMVRCGLIDEPKTLTKRRYREIEGILRKVAERSSLELGELDLYLWYMETGRVLK
ncbi:MAG: N-glycosylase/DNA lyase [Candidatus Atabeyarchaeum deiterrae]